MNGDIANNVTCRLRQAILICQADRVSALSVQHLAASQAMVSIAACDSKLLTLIICIEPIWKLMCWCNFISASYSSAQVILCGKREAFEHMLTA